MFLSTIRMHVRPTEQRLGLSTVSSSNNHVSPTNLERHPLLAPRHRPNPRDRAGLQSPQSSVSRGLLPRFSPVHRRIAPTGRDLPAGSTPETRILHEFSRSSQITAHLARSWKRYHKVRDETAPGPGLLEPISQRGLEQQSLEHAPRREATISQFRNGERPCERVLRQETGESIRP